MDRRLSNEETVKKIEDIMIDLLNEKNFEKITVSEISKLAGINRTTFYLFYESKDELVSAICDSFFTNSLDTFFESLRKRMQLSDQETVMIFNGMLKNEKMIKTVIGLQYKGVSNRTRMEHSLKREITNYYSKQNVKIKHGISLDLFATMYAANVMTTFLWWINNHEETNATVISHMIRDISFDGLLNLVET